MTMRNPPVFISFLIIAGLFLTVSVNYGFVRETSDTLERFLAEFPADISGEAEAAAAYALWEETFVFWEARRPLLTLSVERSSLNEFCGLIDTLEAYILCRKEAEYRKTLALLDNAICDIARLERFSYENLF